MPDKTTIGVSDTFREYIEALVEEVVINSEPFEAQKKWLRKNSEAEGLDYVSFEKNLEDLFQIIEEWRASQSKSCQIAMKMLAKDCFLSEDVIEKLLSVKNKSRRSGILEGHEYVDLGLPSGTFWATCNVGAETPECEGNFYAWGELEEKEVYSLNTYNHGEGTWNSLRDIGENICGTQFDVAHVKWGGKWRIPSIEQMDELLECCAIEYDGYSGFIFKSKKNGNSIYLPLCGSGVEDNIISESTYWTGNKDGKGDAHCLLLYWDADMEDENGMCLRDNSRMYYGGVIRPVALL
jgi:hypothetical protein